jgi:hypothetical protein
MNTHRTSIFWILLLGTFVVGFGSVQATQAQSTELGQIEQALLDNNTRELGLLMASRVEVSIQGTSSVYTRDQAAYVVGDFLRRHPAQSVEFVREMHAGEGIYYVTVAYQHTRGTSTLILQLSQRGNRWELRDLRIE